MSTDPIVIVGAGPAGLVLALSLAQYKVHVRCGHNVFMHIFFLTHTVGDFGERTQYW